MAHVRVLTGCQEEIKTEKKMTKIKYLSLWGSVKHYTQEALLERRVRKREVAKNRKENNNVGIQMD